MARTIALALGVGTFAVFATVAGFADEHRPRVTYGEALQWYFDAAQAGNAQAQFLLGLKYETGTDVAPDMAEAANWYEKAARQGVPEAQFKLATLLERGRGRNADPAAATQWYERAARAGYAPAQYNLGVLKLNSAASEVERIDGLVWLIRAREQGIEPAADFVARVKTLWPAEIVAEAERRAAQDLAVDPNRTR